MMHIQDGIYVVAMWMVPLIEPIDQDGVIYPSGDFLQNLWRDKGEDFFRFEYRFRFHVDGLLFPESKDKVSRYAGTVHDDEASALTKLGSLAEALAAKSGTSCHKLIIRSSDVAFIVSRMRAEDFMHERRIPRAS